MTIRLGLRPDTPTRTSARDSRPDLLRTYGRTDGLTEKPLTPRSHGFSSVPRTHVRRFDPMVALSTGRSLRDQATQPPDPDAVMVMAVLNADHRPLTTERLVAAARAYAALRSSRDRTASSEVPDQEARPSDQEEPAP